MYSRKEKILQGENILRTVLSTVENKIFGRNWKSLQVYLRGKETEAISAIRNTVNYDAENLGLVPIYEAKSGKKSNMDQELDICDRVYEIAKNNMRRVCVTIEKNNVNKPPYIQIRLFTSK